MLFSIRSSVVMTAGVVVLAGLAGCGDSEVTGKKASEPGTVTPSFAKKTDHGADGATSKPAVVELKPKDDDMETADKPSTFPELPKGAGPIDPDAPEEFTETDSGLRYRILRKSEGRKPIATSEVVAHYKGWLDNGKQFDSSYDRGQPTPFPLDGVIAGWTEGLQLIGEGAMIELEIPGKLGYPRGRPGIPPNATLHFIVELKKVR
jgi:FKBP-type peptidyl-prolyl cis-trans isomerase